MSNDPVSIEMSRSNYPLKADVRPMKSCAYPIESSYEMKAPMHPMKNPIPNPGEDHLQALRYYH